MLNQFSIGSRLIGSFLFAAMITLVTGGVGVYFTNTVGNQGILAAAMIADHVTATMAAKLKATEAHVKFEELMNGDTAESIDHILALMQEAQSNLEMLQRGGSTPVGAFIPLTQTEALQLVNHALLAWDTLESALQQRYASKNKQLSKEEFNKLDANFDSTFEAYIDQVSELGEYVRKEQIKQQETLKRETETSQMILLMLIAVAFGIGLLLGQVITRSITKPLQRCLHLAQTIASGNLATQLTPLGQDEIAQLVVGLEHMRKQLSTVIGSIYQNVNTLNSAASNLSSAANSSAKIIEEQSDAANSKAASIEQLSVSIDQVGNHAEDARNLAILSGTQSLEGGRIIHQAAIEMTGIANSVVTTAESIRELESFSEQISSIVNVIKDIADQTNLLALNAAIEAARAGEQGRGFAVVADEVRKLAERTAKSTQEVTPMISKIQQETQNAAEKMEIGVQRANYGEQLAEQAGSSVIEIRDSADQVSHAVNGISQAVAEQVTAAREIAQRVDKIAQGTESNSTTAFQIAQSAQMLEQLAQALHSMCGQFRTE